MATKAEIARYVAERSGPKRLKKPKRPRRAARNRSTHAARKGGVTLEDSGTKPSRKSTRKTKGQLVSVGWTEDGVEFKRKGEGRVKPAANLTLKAIVKTRSPQERSQRKLHSKAKLAVARTFQGRKER